MSIDFKPYPYAKFSQERLRHYADHFVFQTREWLDFIRDAQEAEPLCLEIHKNDELLGYYTGLIVKKFGVKILGSPFPGWTTMYMGFTLSPGVCREELVEPLVSYAFSELGVVHFEMIDRYLDAKRLSELDVEVFSQESMEIDLTPPEEQLYANMSKKSCRYSIRKAEKSGVRIVQATDEGFVTDYYTQLKDVFKKQGLVPTYDERRVALLIKHLLPTGNLLLLRAVDDEETCIATGIFPACNAHMIFWGGASWRKYQNLCPNEALIWHAMKYWKEKGIQWFDMGGGRGYKKKYGGYPITVPGIRKSKYRFLGQGRELAKKMFGQLQEIRGRFSAG